MGEEEKRKMDGENGDGWIVMVMVRRGMERIKRKRESSKTNKDKILKLRADNQ